jgi:site-specific recombinase XerD
MQMVNEYLTALQAVGKSPKTIQTYRTQLTKFLEWMAKNSGSDDPRTITSIDAVEYRTYLQEVRNLKPASVNTALASIDAFCAWMVENGYRDHNPVVQVKRVEQVQQPPKWLTKNEKYRLIRTALAEKDKRNTVIVLTFVMAGLRASELVELKPDDVLLGERKGSIVVRAGKGNKQRVVPIPNDLRKALGEYLTAERASCKWLFGSQRGDQLSYDGVYQLCVALGKKAGVEGLTPHVLRHTYCHDLVSKGIRLEMVAKLAGHSKIETTMIYTQPGEEELQSAVEKLSFT